MLLNINANVIWTVVDLLILFLLMKKFLFGPVTAMLDQRAAAINADLDDAKAQKQAADVLLADHERQIGEARAEAGRIVADAKRRAEAAYEQKLAQAQEEIQRMPLVRLRPTAVPCWHRLAAKSPVCRSWRLPRSRSSAWMRTTSSRWSMTSCRKWRMRHE